MLTEKEKKMCRALISVYKKNLKKFVSGNTSLPAGEIVKEYENRFFRYMDAADMGSARPLHLLPEHFLRSGRV